jgi:hypothetical protein
MGKQWLDREAGDAVRDRGQAGGSSAAVHGHAGQFVVGVPRSRAFTTRRGSAGC